MSYPGYPETPFETAMANADIPVPLSLPEDYALWVEIGDRAIAWLSRECEDTASAIEMGDALNRLWREPYGIGTAR